MKKKIALAIALLLSTSTFTQVPKPVQLPNGWRLSPVGKALPLGDLPLNMAVSPNEKLIAVTNNGQSVQSIQLIDAVNHNELSRLTVGKAWYGLSFSKDNNNLYASGGNDNCILVYDVSKHTLVLKDSLKLGKKWPVKISPAGLCIDNKKGLLYTVTKENNSLYIYDLKRRKIVFKDTLNDPAYTCLLSPSGRELYISVWGGKKISVFDTKHRTFITHIEVGENPNELLLNRNGKYLYAAIAGDNAVAVIDIKKRKVVEVLNAALFPNAPTGSSTNGLALSKNEKILYVANADNNCLAVFNVEKPGFSHSMGFIPVGWYPTNIKVIGTNIFVTNGKGFSSMPNPYGPNPVDRKQAVIWKKADPNKPDKEQYIAGLFKGTLSIIAEPNEVQLATYSRQVYENTPYSKQRESISNGEPGNPIPMQLGNASPIKHVFYIIKENRTYDQVLGDMPQGNGDTSLVLFGEHITPNQHKLSQEFVLLDNFYVDGEVSADGHNWSMAAHSNDYLEKTWPTDYGGRGGSYDAEGVREIANPDRGFIWDYCKRAGVTYRTYGEFADDYKANLPVLENHFCPYFTSWDQRVRDTTRFNQWRRDFDSLYAAHAVPGFNSLRFINDHTEGTSIGRPTPYAHVADNDLAVGMFVDYLSHHPIWKECAIFIVEDDAQNGPDHVDAHRTTAYMAGGFVKRGYVDHTMYSTSSMLRTMELILGLQPMSQYDAAAEPMWRSFAKEVNVTPFNHVSSNVNLNDKNKRNTPSAKVSATLDFSKEDRIPDLVFSEIIWKAVKGEHSTMPAPVRSAFLKTNREADKDDD